MRNALVLALVLGAGCAGEGPAPGTPAAPGTAAGTSAPRRLYQRPALPKASELPCFACHDLATWSEGPGFPHELEPHKEQGHCHVCHAGVGHHEPMTIRREVCLQCHEQPPGLAPEPRPAP